MEPIAIAPAATVAFYRRVFVASHGRVRILGRIILTLVAVPLYGTDFVIQSTCHSQICEPHLSLSC